MIAAIRSLFFALLFVPAVASAHPVAQGNGRLKVLENEIDFIIAVSLEEIVVQHSLGAQVEGAEKTEPFEAHAKYLQSHLKFTLDGVPVSAEVVSTPKDVNDSSALEQLVPFGFRIKTMSAPREIEISQDLLREIQYVPGNNWEASFVVQAIDREGNPLSQGLLTSAAPLKLSLVLGAPQSNMQLFREYVQHGIHHILSGYDHLLFVSALVLAAATFMELLLVVTAFTIAHTVTLALSAFDIVRLSPSIVEPMIAVSIVVVALQNIFSSRQRKGMFRLTAAFFFGLFHGLGFAGGLLDAMGSMPVESALGALASFSLGVEIGHQVVIIPLYLAFVAISRVKARESRGYAMFQYACSLMIAVAGGIIL